MRHQPLMLGEMLGHVFLPVGPVIGARELDPVGAEQIVHRRTPQQHDLGVRERQAQGADQQAVERQLVDGEGGASRQAGGLLEVAFRQRRPVGAGRGG